MFQNNCMYAIAEGTQYLHEGRPVPLAACRLFTRPSHARSHIKCCRNRYRDYKNLQIVELELTPTGRVVEVPDADVRPVS